MIILKDELSAVSGQRRINMSNVHESECYFDGNRTVSGEMICLSEICMICKDGTWEKTNKISVL
jgi:hypothetical protein